MADDRADDKELENLTPAAGDEADSETVATVLDGIPGAPERVTLAREEISRGEGIPLEEL